MGSRKLLPWIQQMLDGWQKEDPSTTNQFPVEAVISLFLVNRGNYIGATELNCSVKDLAMTVFYYLLHVGDYTVEEAHNEINQTEQFEP